MKKHPSISRILAVLQLVPLLFLCNLAQASVIHYQATLDGPSEAPSNLSPGIGLADVIVDDTANTMRVIVSFGGLLGGVTASHIHAATAVANTGTASVATQTPSFIGFPTGVMSGSYDHTFDLTLASTYRAGYITSNGGTAATAALALLSAMAAEKSYYNIHTTAFPGGEIRGFLRNVPDAASTALLLALALGAMGGFTRRQQLRN